MKKITVFLILGLIFLGGCTTIQRGTATGAVAGGTLGAVVGHQSDHTTEGAAIGVASGAIASAEKMEKKFCPECGRRFTSSVEVCPYDGTELKIIGDTNN
ncbi:MAG: glycine zipper 2TM domain-containing protein [Candidatus Omnitrophota bacterium]|nr:MAG: glycine zipper 2TM domain-containing protein [Candidatus Omnitrophota bacterium]